VAITDSDVASFLPSKRNGSIYSVLPQTLFVGFFNPMFAIQNAFLLHNYSVGTFFIPYQEQ
jgi:hypothetical protein